MSEMRVVDVVVVGYGGAGATAAIVAHDAGAEVFILEKAEEGGGATRESNGTIRRLKDVQGAIAHYEACAMGSTPRAVLATFAENVNPVVDWLVSIGAEVETWEGNAGYPPIPLGSAYPHLPGADCLANRVKIKPKHPEEMGGVSLWDVLHAAVGKRKIPVVYNARASHLIQDEPFGAVKGVVYDGPNGRVTVKARRGVILTCGGFAFNEQMHRDYLGGVGMGGLGPPGRNTGDGIHIAAAAGGDLWHMTASAAPFGYRVPEREAAYMHRMYTMGYIYVDKHGARFANESELELHACAITAFVFDPEKGGYPRIPAYLIFDESTRQQGPIAYSKTGWNRRFPWSKDNAEEVKRGWIKSAQTVEELAAKLGLPADHLAKTVAAYNDACAKQKDPAFGRKAEHLVPILKPPFYGIDMWPVLVNTQGGPRRDETAHIVSTQGKPIPRLYAAGELGSIWSLMYPGGANVTEAMVFGRIAGRNAAAETPLN